jgi:hypothetical protein
MSLLHIYIEFDGTVPRGYLRFSADEVTFLKLEAIVIVILDLLIGLVLVYL